VAHNLAAVDHDRLRRGDAVVRPTQWATPLVVDVAVTAVDDEDRRPRRRRLHAAVGSGEHRVWFRALDPDGRLARLRFESPLPLAPGDRMVLRDLGRRRTVAGVEVLDVRPARRAADAPTRLGRPLGERLLAAEPWLSAETLTRDGGLSAADAAVLADDLVARGVAARRGRALLDTATMAALRAATLQQVEDHHRRRPHDAGVELVGLASDLRVAPELLRAALEDDPHVVVDRGVVHRRDRAGRAAESAAGRRVLAAFEATPFAPPSAADAGDPGLVRNLVRDGALVDVEGVVFAASALAAARSAVVEALRERPRLTVAEIRDVLGTTRKFAVPICRWLDRQGVTRRRGDDRIAGPASGLGAAVPTPPGSPGAPDAQPR
jgi:selenocysteine-specific elongation factor